MNHDRKDSEKSAERELGLVRLRNKKQVSQVLIAAAIVGSFFLIPHALRILLPVFWSDDREELAVVSYIPGYHGEAEVMEFILEGTPLSMVIERFGEPQLTREREDGSKVHVWHAGEPDRRYIYDFAFSGFTVVELVGVVQGCSAAHRSTSR